MPLYDTYCANCDRFFEQFALIAKRDELKCPDCECEVERIPTAPAIVGGKGIDVSMQLGREFSSVRELEAHCASIGKEVVSAGDSSERKKRDTARENAERSARKAGFSDLAALRAQRKKDKGA
jgi:putative FmdB family regulatory protein